MDTPQHIIINRTDNIGDVVLTLPLASLLKQRFPHCKISFLARDYVESLIVASPDVDAFISWDQLKNAPHSQAVSLLKALQADTILHVFPNKQIAQLAKAANIKKRIGSSHRWYHWLTCNKCVNFSRKNSTLHEAQLNLKLLAPLALATHLSLVELQALLQLNKSKEMSNVVKGLLAENRFNLIVHPLTNGNTKEWPLEKFTSLIQSLSPEKFNIIISGTDGERERLQTLLTSCPNVKDAIGKLSLAEFMQLLSHADGIVANSTGPLHIAAALGIHALGLYPTEKGKDVGRWGPLGTKTETISADDMDLLSSKEIEIIIQNWHAKTLSLTTTCV